MTGFALAPSATVDRVLDWLFRRHADHPTEAQSAGVRIAAESAERIASVADEIDGKTQRILTDVLATQQLTRELRSLSGTRD